MDSPLERISAVLVYHEVKCPLPTKAILLHPANYELLGVESVDGVPVVADESVEPGRFRIDRDGSTADLEQQLARAIDQGVPVG